MVSVRLELTVDVVVVAAAVVAADAVEEEGSADARAIVGDGVVLGKKEPCQQLWLALLLLPPGRKVASAGSNKLPPTSGCEEGEEKGGERRRGEEGERKSCQRAIELGTYASKRRDVVSTFRGKTWQRGKERAVGGERYYVKGSGKREEK